MWSALVAALWLAVAPSSAKVLTPPYFNLAEGRKITATATCGDEGPELYCKLVGANAQNDNNINVIQGQVCDICDLNTPGKNHPPEYAVDGMESWWQSPPLSRGMKLNEVNLTIDLGQEFHVAYVFVRMGNSPRPGLWALEKSSDYGKTYTPWQYFSDSPSDCETNFGKESLLPITRDDSVICNTEYSKIVPLEAGEIPISLLINRPSANMYFNSSVLQEWTRATNIRLRLLRTKTLLGHLMSVARQDPTVTRRYFYSIKDISIGGRCMCNGHADTCDIPDPIDPNKLQCRCQHHTCGPQCEKCCPGFEQKAWRQSSITKFVCEACNCFNHTDKCVYDPKIDAQHLSLDIHGKYDGGGVCVNCQHNTEGINCNKCKSKYYRPYNKKWEEIDVCQPCDCDNYYSTGNCAEESGQCECRKEFKSPHCDECSYGYYGYPDCKPCVCNLNGTDGDLCEPIDNYCPCKPNYDGNFCETCAEGYYNFPKCDRCNCNQAGAISSACEQESGNCTCKSNFGGRTCEECEAGFYQYPACHYCNCDISGTLPQVCDNFTGICICKEGFGGSRCDQCIAGYYTELRDRERVCVECQCYVNGSTSTTCDTTGKCSCLNNFVGKRCDKCSPGYYKYPECLPCNCDSRGSEGVACDETGQCNCKGNFDDLQCSSCKESFYNFPRCEECNCDPNGIIQSFAGCGSVPAGELCQCKERVQGRICDECRPLYWNLQQNNILGCQECDCDVRGTQAGIGTCDSKTGQCNCKYAVMERGCSECKDGSYNLTESNIFGCTDCGCDVGGAVNNNCDKENGKCKCRPRIEGLHCDKPLKTHYFPTLHQFQYEIEDGQTPTGSAVRYGYSQELFPDFSWKGYAVFNFLQDEVLQNVEIEKSSVYQMVLRYVNQNPEPISGKITITPDNPSETEQSFEVLIKPSTTPRFVTVSGLAGDTPSPFVMNPGRWTVSIMTNKNLLLDYFVLIPSSYYEATILLQKVNTPCEIEGKGLCRHFGYPNISGFDSVYGSSGHFSKDNEQFTINKFIDSAQIRQLKEKEIPLIEDEGQLDLELIISEPGDYVLLLEYVTPIEKRNMGGGYITAVVHSGSSKSYSKIYLTPCTYTQPCRHVLLDDNKTVQIFSFEDDLVQANIKGEGNAAIGLKSIVAIPLKDWHTDFIKPQSICIRKNGKCAQGTYPFPPNSKKIEFETENKISLDKKPTYIYDNSTELLYLSAGTTKDLVLKVPNPGQYVFVVQYYQPNHPENKMDILIENDQFNEGFLLIKHCPSNSGCRSVVQTADGSNRFSLTENYDFSLRTNNEIWLDYLLVIPADQYDPAILDENKFDQTREFISTCGNNHFHINITEEGFCRDAVFSLTSDYNNGAELCRCDYLGSHSFECDLFGGQCKCKPNIIGRKCEICKTGYYGFPDCKPCKCPSTATCEKESGECICPPRVTGENCDKCMPLTYGVHPIIGCVDCNCDPSGVENDLQCDLFNGSCTCKKNVVGRACDKCEAGHFQFPDCEECECDLKGSTKEICDQETAICSCKQHVFGSACDTCREGTFDLRESNDEGCTKCFCFGKTIRCNSANNLYWDKIIDMEGWALFDINVSNKINVTQHSRPPKRNNATSISAEFSSDSDQATVYFGAPKEYLGNKLTSYGGKLKYTLYYTTGIFGNAISKDDIILQSTNISLLHSGIEQPPIGQNWDKILYLTESEFVTLNGLPATRELLMTVLENLQGVYIRATYWESTIISRLQNVSLDFGNDIWDTESEIASSVEECQCPVNYKGYSCEDCAEGYYRIPGTHGGICIPCQCNGHAASCDVETGICHDCQHATIGDHCEMCMEGYHGNATVGTPNDCLICACPLPTKNNNFATSCEVSPNGKRISCDCKPGYFGARCESCAAGYFGLPEVPNEYCKPCECSGNINPNDPSSCDTKTGQCLKCMNNTFGESCSLCEPGFFGDAIVLKDCQVCICDQLGMARCNSHTGSCECQTGVVGDKCDRCEDEHWGFEFGNGCSPCNCSVASQSKQCHDSTGQCKCMPGVTGKHCDKCAPGFWNFSPQGCITCDCNSNYSVGFGCNVNTGHCECLQGVVGEKCDRCPYRYVLIPEQGCFQCDSCTHDLLNSTEILSNLIDPVMIDIETKASSYFTAQRLLYIEDKVGSLKDSVNSLDTNAVDLDQISNKMNNMESMWKNLDRTVNYAVKDSAKNKKNAENLVKQWEKVLKDAKLGSIKTNETVKQIWQLADNLVTGHGQKVDSALAEGQKILMDIKDKEFSAQHKAALNVQNFTNETFDNFKKGFTNPLNDSQLALKNVQKQMSKYNDDLDDLLKIYKNLQKKIESTEKLNEMIDRISNIKNKVSVINDDFDKGNDNLEDASRLLKNASKFLESTKNGLIMAQNVFSDGFMINDQMNKTLNERSDNMNEIKNLIVKAEDHQDKLLQMSNVLQNLLKTTTDNTQTENAVKAASAYSDIAKEINEAQNASLTAENAVFNASELNNNLRNHIIPSQENSTNSHKKALKALNTVQGELRPKLLSAEKIIDDIRLQYHKSDDDNNAVLQSIPELPFESLEVISTQIKRNSTAAQKKSKGISSLADEIDTENKLLKTKNISKDAHDSLNNIELIKNQLNNVQSTAPNVSNLIENVRTKENYLDKKKRSLEKLKGELEKSLATAKDTANRIKVGVHFNESTYLQLPLPDDIEEMGTTTHISVYFKTSKEHGFLLYLGNPRNTKVCGDNNADFIALEIENGYPFVNIDMGDGPEKLTSDKIVIDDVWYQAIINRVGNHIKFTIREQLPDGTEKNHVVEKELSGSKTVLNYQKDHTKLFVGGYKVLEDLNDHLKFDVFDGQIEELVIGDTPIGFWNFIEIHENNYGAKEREVLLDKSTTGFRFNGESYVVIDGRSYLKEETSSIEIRFSTFASEGLLFLIGKEDSFLSIELQNGSIFFQFRLGTELVVIGTLKKYNDGKPHTVQALRDHNKGKLTVDNVVQDYIQSNSDDVDTLTTTGYVYLGGYPGKHHYIEVTNTGFDGCIDDVKLSSYPVDLNINVEAFGVKPGCPNKISNSVVIDGRGCITIPNISIDNNVGLSIRFKTSSKFGLIFYATDRNQEQTVSLSLTNGYLSFISQEETLTSGLNTYNDDQWHTVRINHNNVALKITVDDCNIYTTDSSPPRLDMMYGNLYIGGVPPGFVVRPARVASKEQFKGCLGDAIINNNMINFAADEYGKNLRSCKKPVKYSNSLSSLTAPLIPGTPQEKTSPDSRMPKQNERVQSKPTIIQQTPKKPSIPSPPAELPTKNVSSKPSVPLTPAPSKPAPPPEKREESCTTGYDPISSQWNHADGFRFGTRMESRVEFDRLPDNIQNDFRLSVDFNSKSKNGLLFYASDASHDNFIILFISEGQINFNFNYNRNQQVTLKSPKRYDDSEWHKVIIKKVSDSGLLIIDDEKVGSTESRDLLNPLLLSPPFYYGGINISGNIHKNLEPFNYTPFNGCLKNLKINGKSVESIKAKINTLPCLPNEDNGVYFRNGGGFLKLIDTFNIGEDTTIQMQVKLRNSSGVLVAVHGKKHYFILEIVNSTLVVLRAYNGGKDPTVASYVLNQQNSICDGKWHTIHGIKSKHVLSLGIDENYGDAVPGYRRPLLHTSSALFIGGHPSLSKRKSLRGATVTHGFTGCIRNIVIANHQYKDIELKSAHGDVHIGMCPPN